MVLATHHQAFKAEGSTRAIPAQKERWKDRDARDLISAIGTQENDAVAFGKLKVYEQTGKEEKKKRRVAGLLLTMDTTSVSHEEGSGWKCKREMPTQKHKAEIQ